MYRDDFLNKKIQERVNNHSLRELRLPSTNIDFCSNDYLGIAFHSKLNLLKPQSAHGSTGSRLLSGNYPAIEQLETKIAQFHEADAALIFNSGYDANIGLLSSIPQKGDTIFYDQLSHASLRDGIRLSFAQSYSFKHNDLQDLQQKLALATGNIFIVTESVFSMDGDCCPLEELVQMAASTGAHLIIDEAHATGIIGKRGEGLVQYYGMQSKVFARIHTFGKALGCHGAVVLGSQKLRTYLINFARSLVYTTALPEHTIDAIHLSYDLFPNMQTERKHLDDLIHLFQSHAKHLPILTSQTPIQIIMVPGNEEARALAEKMQQQQMDIRAILYPTVPKGEERLRIVLHAFNTLAETEKLLDLLKLHLA